MAGREISNLHYLMVLYLHKKTISTYTTRLQDLSESCGVQKQYNALVSTYCSYKFNLELNILEMTTNKQANSVANNQDLSKAY